MGVDNNKDTKDLGFPTSTILPGSYPQNSSERQSASKCLPASLYQPSTPKAIQNLNQPPSHNHTHTDIHGQTQKQHNKTYSTEIHSKPPPRGVASAFRTTATSSVTITIIRFVIITTIEPLLVRLRLLQCRGWAPGDRRANTSLKAFSSPQRGAWRTV